MSREIDFSKPLDEDEAQYVAERPWLRREAEFQGLEVRYASDTFEEAEDEDEDEVDYSKFTKKELLAEIDRRNEEREDEEDHIVPENDKNDTLVAALEADDEDNAEEGDETE